MSERVIVAGVSARAMSTSAARAGFDVVSIDAFGDLDQHPSVQHQALGARYSARRAASVSREFTCNAVAYTANFENHPAAVAGLASGRALWGNSPSVLARVRNPEELVRILDACKFPTLAVRVDTSPDKDDSRRWLLKPLASGGGSRVREWRSGTPRPRRTYLQELAQGVVGSVAFVAAGGQAMPLAISRQLVGDRAFGATGYQYCGNILAASGESQFQDEQIRSRLSTLVRLAAREFQLVGVNGIDFIARDSVPYLLEVNPRWTASMELAERTSGVSVFGLHAAACLSGTLPTPDENASRMSAVGKAIVYASRDVTIGDTTGWLDDEDVRDIPRPGEAIAAGRPICTVFAEGHDSVACYRDLVRRAERVYAAVESFNK